MRIVVLILAFALSPLFGQTDSSNLLDQITSPSKSACHRYHVSPKANRVESIYIARGEEAHFIRAHLACYGKEYVQKCLQEELTELYGTTQIDQPIEVKDDTSLNVLEISCSFVVDDLAQENLDENIYTFSFIPSLIVSELPQHVETIGKFPVALTHPVKIDETISIYTTSSPDDIEFQEVIVDHPAFSFKRTITAESFLQVRFEYETKTNLVLPEDLPSLREKLDEIEQLSYLTYSYPINGIVAEENVSSTTENNWGVIFGLLVIAVLIIILIKVNRELRQAPTPEHMHIRTRKGWKIAFWVMLILQLPVSALGLTLIFSEGPSIFNFIMAACVMIPILWMSLLYVTGFLRGGTKMLRITCYLLVPNVLNILPIYFLVHCIRLYTYNRGLQQGIEPSQPSSSTRFPPVKIRGSRVLPD